MGFETYCSPTDDTVTTLDELPNTITEVLCLFRFLRLCKYEPEEIYVGFGEDTFRLLVFHVEGRACFEFEESSGMAGWKKDFSTKWTNALALWNASDEETLRKIYQSSWAVANAAEIMKTLEKCKVWPHSNIALA